MIVEKERLEQKLGESLGLEMAAQKAVEELSSKGLLPNEPPTKKKLEGMRKEANNHQRQMENLVIKLSQSDGIDSSKVQGAAQETEEKAIKIMEIYLGDNRDTQEALEFLCLAEGGEVTRGIKNKQFQAKVRSILNQEKKHLLLCIQLAKKNACK